MKNIAIVLAGGVGSRMGNTGMPKQYLKINNKPIIAYCLEILQNSNLIDEIFIVANSKWIGVIEDVIFKYNISKFKSIVDNGESRQESILNALNLLISMGYSTDSVVLIHDAARPFLNDRLISDCLSFSTESFDGSLPVLPVTDTIYQSSNQRSITNLLDRDTLFAGQSPECFLLGKYYNCHRNLDSKSLHNIKGSSEIAFGHGLKIKLIKGDSSNFKVTTLEDLFKLETLLGTNK